MNFGILVNTRMINVGNDWQLFFDKEQNQPYYEELRKFLKQEYATHVVYPPMNDIFNAFKLTDLPDVKVVILGQDCYHGSGQAMGLSFSVHEGVEEPPSLRNIHKEIIDENALQGEWNCDLTRWSKQGVLLLNSILTVREHEPGSHANHGWETLTDNVISLLNYSNEPKVFILWGSYARSKKKLITNRKHLVLESAHPSPLSAYRGFFGNNHFNLTNEFLKAHNLTEIYW